MQRTDNSTSVPTLPTPKPAGTPGYFYNGNKDVGELGTIVSDDFLNMVQEELINATTLMGLTADKTKFGQVAQSISRAAGANFTYVTASQTLTPDHVGIVIVDSTNGPINLVLPLVAAFGGKSARLFIARTDATANTVTLTRQGTNQIDFQNTKNVPSGFRIQLFSEPGGNWIQFRDVQEVLDRTAADNGLQTNINTANDVRYQEDVKLSNRIITEVNDRATQCNNLFNDYTAKFANKVDKESGFSQLGNNALQPGGSGYMKLPNNWIIQWGLQTTDATGAVNFTFPVTFAQYCAVLQVNESAADGWGISNPPSPTIFGVATRAQGGAVVKCVSINPDGSRMWKAAQFSYVAIGF